MASTLSCWSYNIENRILLTINANILDLQIVPTGLTFDPELVTTGTPESGHPTFACRLQRQFISIADNQYLTSLPILSDCWQHICAAVGDLQKFCKIKIERIALF